MRPEISGLPYLALDKLNEVAARAAAAIKDGQDLRQRPERIREALQIKKELTDRLAEPSKQPRI